MTIPLHCMPHFTTLPRPKAQPSIGFKMNQLGHIDAPAFNLKKEFDETVSVIIPCITPTSRLYIHNFFSTIKLRIRLLLDYYNTDCEDLMKDYEYYITRLFLVSHL